jgi:rod shape-determining protein MreC
MNTLLRFLERFQFLIVFILLEIFSIWLLVSFNYYHKASFGKFSNTISSLVEKRVKKVNQFIHLKETNIQLAKENVHLLNQLANLKLQLSVNRNVKTDSIAGVKYTFIQSRIINNSTDNQHNFITLDIGSKDGVEKEMGVITGDGVIGVVASVSKNFSTAISLLNIDLKVSVKHKKSNTFGSIHWDGLNYQKLILTEIPQHVNLSVGDTIVTSGFSEIFPSNIPIGLIESFNLKGGSFYEIKVNMLSDFKRIDYVYIVKSHLVDERKEIENIDIDE